MALQKRQRICSVRRRGTLCRYPAALPSRLSLATCPHNTRYVCACSQSRDEKMNIICVETHDALHLSYVIEEHASLSSECCAAKLKDGFLLKVAVDAASGAEESFCTDCERIHFVQQRHGRRRSFFQSERLSNYSLASGRSRHADWLLSKLNRSKCAGS